MKTEFRVIYTATFDTAAERDKAADALKSFITGGVMATAETAASMGMKAEEVAICKRADIVKDEYLIAENTTVSEKVI